MSDKKILVSISDTPVGTLSQDQYGMLIFQYSEEYIENNGDPISASLPVRHEQYYGGPAHAYFTGLLPEEGILEQMAKVIGTDKNNNFRLLEELGKECVGAVRIGKNQPDEKQSYQELTIAQFGEIIKKKGSLLPFLYTSGKQRLSMAGAQSKFGMLYKNSKFYLPKYGAPSNVIVKPKSTKFPDLVYNEYATMKIAHRFRIIIPEVRLINLEETELYMIDRYDRVLEKSSVNRIHQEDFCQALGIQSAFKYENDGGPGFTECIELIRRICKVPILDIQKFIDIFLFNLVIGNRDAHGKNYSFIRRHDLVYISPAYDLVSTTLYPELSAELAMSINGKFHVETLTKDDLTQMAEKSGINKSAFYKRYIDFKETIIQQAEIVLKEEVFPNDFKKRFLKQIEINVSELPR